MKRQKHHHNHFPGRVLCAYMALGLALLVPQAAFCADSVPSDIYEAQSDLNAAQSDLRQAERDFEQAGKVVDEGTSAQTTWSQLQEPQPLPKAEPESAQKPAHRMPKKEPRVSVSQNVAPGYDGYMGTYVDPANGDIVTSVIAPKRQQNDDYTNYPIIIEPQVGDYGWNNGGSNWNSGWNAGWGGPGWQGPGQQVPGYPYPPAGPGFSPSGQVPGYPYPPANPGYGPPPPPGYGWDSPPGPGPDFKPGWPGQNRPPKPGGNNPGGIFPPNVPPPGPGFGPGQGPAINPGRPPRPGSGPGYPPAMPPRPGFGPGQGTSYQGPGFHPGFGPGFHPGFGPGHGPGPRPGFGHGPGFGPRSELTPPKNPDRRGSLPLVAPNFPPKVHHEPFVNLYHAPELSAPGLHAGGAPTTSKIPASRTYFVPGSAQSWDASNWQAGKGGM